MLVVAPEYICQSSKLTDLEINFKESTNMLFCLEQKAFCGQEQFLDFQVQPT